MMKTALLLDRYQLIEELGSGGFSRVYKAFDTRMQRLVAIKEIPAAPKTTSRAKREARTSALLNHPNIVTLYEYEETASDHYLIMEYIEGIPLRELLDWEEHLRVEQALAASFQICIALEYAHLNYVVHRDIKPENLMLLPDGRVKVTDFGIARLISSVSITREGDILGTFSYMSPEQVRGERVDDRTDIFSSGVVLYEMLTGVNPFEAQSSGAAVFKILNTVPNPPSQLNPEIPPQLDKVILKALAKDPNERYDTVTDFRYKLERLNPEKIPPEKTLKKLARSYYEDEKDAKKEETEEVFVFSLEKLKNFLGETYGKHHLLIKRLGGAFLLGFSSEVLLQRTSFYPDSLNLFIPLFISFITFLFPLGGMVAFVAALIPLAAAKSPLLGSILIVLALGYGFSMAQKKPLAALIPAAAPLLQGARLGLMYPLAVGLAFRPPIAGLLGGLGSLALQIYSLFSSPEVVALIPWDETTSFSRGESDPLTFLFKSFTHQPSLIYSLILWILVSLLVSTLTFSRSLKRDLFGISAGFFLIVLGYLIIPLQLGFAPASPARTMQTLSLSLIILVIFLLFTPYQHLRKNPPKRIKKEEEGEENEPA